MPCTEMRELEAIREDYVERRRRVVHPERERRKSTTGFYRLGQFHVSFLMQCHRKNCAVCGVSK
jgi:hypothetical protein